MSLELNGRPVTDIMLDGVDSRDYPDFCDAFIYTATWEDTGVELSDDELEQLNKENGDYINEEALDSLY